MKNLILALSLGILPLCAHSADKEAMMKKMQEYSTPSEAHKTLASMEGNWTYSSKWWEKPDAKPEESKGTSSMKMILGGRYLQQTVKGTAMGQAFEGMGLTGYDNLKKKYDTIWLDSMSTGVIHGKGDFDQKTKTLTDQGEFTCPMTESHTAEYRGEWKIVDKDNMVYSMYSKGMSGDKVYKTMEMVYKRSK